MFSLVLLSVIIWLSIFYFIDGEVVCKYRGGGRKTSTTVVQAPPPPAAPTATESARDVLQAQLEFNPKAAEGAFDILSNPEFGAEPTTRLLEQVRQNVFTGENDVRNQLLDNVLNNLISPTGITPEQQSAVDARRGQAQDDLTQALRTRANLGGGLFGGRAQNTEQRAVSELQQAFSEEDINRQEQARLNAIQAALPALQILFPDVNITPPQFQSPVPSGTSALQAALTGRGQDIGLSQFNAGQANAAAIADAQNRAAIQSSLFQALGQGAGAAAGAFAACWVAAVIFGGWDHPKTCEARYFINNLAPKWFKDFYTKNGESIARFIKDKPLLKKLLRPLFEMMALKSRIVVNSSLGPA